MRAEGAFFLGAEADPVFEVREMEFGEIGPHEVLVEVRACGVCGTDVHIYHGEKGSADVTPPVVLGHEFSGRVVEVGSEVEVVAPGDHVTLDPNMYCGRCRPCRMGRKQCCEHLFALGVNVNGGFAEYALCPDTQCYPVSKDVGFEAAAMAEPLACAIHGIDQANIREGENVLVIGGGTLGQMMCQLAQAAGASTVILSEPVKLRREVGLALGADAVIDPIHEDLVAEVAEICGAPGADVVIECVGNPRVARQAIDAAGPCGRVVLFSVPAVDATLELPLFDVYAKELTIAGSRINPDTHQRAVNLLDAGLVDVTKLITHRFGIDELEQAILTQQGSDSIKVIVTP